MCAVHLRVGCKKLGFLVFMHPVLHALNHVTSTFLNYLCMASEGLNTLFTLMQRL